MSRSGGNISSECREYAVHIRAQPRNHAAGYNTPSHGRMSKRGELSKQLQQMDVSNRSAEKRSFLIRKSNSKTRMSIEPEENTLDLKKLSIKRIMKPDMIHTMTKSRLNEDMSSMRTVTTTKASFQNRGSFMRTEPSHLHSDTLTVTRKKSVTKVIVEKPKADVWPEKATSLYGKVQRKLPMKENMVQLPLADKKLDSSPAFKPDETFSFGEFRVPRKFPQRENNLLKGFHFEKHRPQKNFHVSMALEEKIKNTVSYEKHKVKLSMLLIQRTLLMLTKVRGKLLDSRLAIDKPYCTHSESPVASYSNIQAHPSANEDSLQDLNSEDDGDEQQSEEDYRRFNYIINHKARPSCAAAVFANLEEAIEGHTHYWLVKIKPLYAFPVSYIRTLYRRRLPNDFNWIGDGSTNINIGKIRAFQPEAITKEPEVDLIIRDKRAKKFQDVYVEENGKLNSDSFQSITLWGYQINKLLSRDIEKDFDEMQVKCLDMAPQLRTLNTVLINSLFKGLKDVEELSNLQENSGRHIALDNEWSNVEYGIMHKTHLKTIVRIEELVHSSMAANKEYFLKGFYRDHQQTLTIMWEKLFIVEWFVDYMTIGEQENEQDSRSVTESGDNSGASQNGFPTVIVNTIEDRSQLDIDSDNKNCSGLSSPMNNVNSTRTFKSSLS